MSFNNHFVKPYKFYISGYSIYYLESEWEVKRHYATKYMQQNQKQVLKKHVWELRMRGFKWSIYWSSNLVILVFSVTVSQVSNCKIMETIDHVFFYYSAIVNGAGFILFYTAYHTECTCSTNLNCPQS